MVEIAVLDDEKFLVDSLELEMRAMGHRVKPFYEARPFLDYIQIAEPDLVFLDLQLPDIHGMEVLQTIRQTLRSALTIIMTAHGDMESAIQALKGGAFDYLNKPFELDEIGIIIERALNEKKLVREVEHHRQKAASNTRLDDFIGSSKPVKKLHQMVKMLTRVDNTTILLRGASGTGKNLIAKAIHNLSARADKQFIVVNCAAIPENLLESELFGYEKGAFTDAKKRKIGLVELADGGTLFLDEVGDLPLPMQVKLLRFLESQTFRRVGGTIEVAVDVLIISATNLDLEEATRQKKFRQDLYYRLNVVPIKIPPLNARGDDILILAEHYLKRFTRRFRKAHMTIGDDAREAFLMYHWPGNVRELKNLIERFVVLSADPVITYDDLPTAMKECLRRKGAAGIATQASGFGYEEKLAMFERDLIDQALRKCSGIKTEAAAFLGISRYALLRKMKRLFNSKTP
jgi:two-component system, NtrC family, response regulator AtoC